MAYRNEEGSKRSAVRLLKVAAARGEKGYRAAMLREMAERFAVHVKAELLAERKLKRAQ
jgi:hypothetical protein